MAWGWGARRGPGGGCSSMSSMSSMSSANSRSGWRRALGEETVGSRGRREGGDGVGGDKEAREVVPLPPRFARESATSLPPTPAWAGTQRIETSVRVRRADTARRVSATCFLLALHLFVLFAASIAYLLSTKTQTGGREDGAQEEKSSNRETQTNWRAANSATLLVASPR